MSFISALLQLNSQEDMPDNTAIKTLKNVLDASHQNGKIIELDQLIDFLKRPKQGAVCAIFFSGRSGSYFAQSFFDQFLHPQVFSVHPVALAAFNPSAAENDIADFKNLPHKYEFIVAWCRKYIARFPYFYTELDSQPGFSAFCVDQEKFTQCFAAVMAIGDNNTLNADELFKRLCIAYRLVRGGPIDFLTPHAYIWQAHVPSPSLKRTIAACFPDYRILTMIRFPEKSLDSHIVHHAYETLSPPFHILLRRLLFEHMAVNNEYVTNTPQYERCIRFEDLHHHTAFVLKAWCEWMGVSYRHELINEGLSMNVQGKNIKGARTLTNAEFACKALSVNDVARIRWLLKEEYSYWGYAPFCTPPLEVSWGAFSHIASPACYAFDVQKTLEILESTSPKSLEIEKQKLIDLFITERTRRDAGLNLISLLYDISALGS